MNCLVLGGGGFLGSHLCEELIKEKHNVKIFEIKNRSKENIRSIEKSICWYEGDFENKNHIKQALEDCDAIFHLIGTTTPQSSNENPIYDVKTNIIPTLNMLEIAKEKRINKIIFFSSGGTVYGVAQKLPIDEKHQLKPRCAYGIQKIAIENYLNLFYNLYNINYTILRISNPYGPRQIVSGNQGVIAACIKKTIDGSAFEIWGDGGVTRDYIYVKDVAKAAVLSLNYTGEKHIFNIGSGIGLSILDVVKIIEKTAQKKIDLVFKTARSCDVPVNIMDNGLAKKEMGWFPRVDIADGIKKTMDYFMCLRKKPLFKKM